MDPKCNSVAQSCPTLCGPMDCSTPGLPVHHQLPEFTQTHVHQVSDAIQPSHLLSSLSIFPSTRSFSNESVLHLRWPNYWSFSFIISLSNEYSGLVSFSTDAIIAIMPTIVWPQSKLQGGNTALPISRKLVRTGNL